MNPDQLKQAIEYAKNNPDDPRSRELQRRIESGSMNSELKAAGMKTFAVKPPVVNLQAALEAGGVQEDAPQSRIPEPKEQKGFLGIDVDLSKEGLKERLRDVGETAKAVGQAATSSVKEAVDIARDDDFTLAQKFMGVLGTGAAGVGEAVGDIAIGVGKLALTEDAEKRLGQMVRNAASDVAETQIAQDVAAWYDSLDKDDKLFVDSVGGMASVMAEMVGLKGVKQVGQAVRETGEAAVPVVREGAEAAAEAVADVPRAVGEVVDTFNDARRPAIVAAQQEKVDTAVGRILQGTPEDVAAGKRALSEIDVTGVENYSDLNKAINSEIDSLAQHVDTELDKFTEKYTPQQVGRFQKVGEETVITSPVQDAFDGLATAYEKSGEAAKAAQLGQLRTKFETEGLTVRELNDLSREYNIEFRDRAFTKMGDPKPGFNAENYENVRKGVKNVVRDRIPEDTVKELDAKMSDLFATRILTKKMEDKVNALQQKITNRTLAQKVGGGAAAIVDLATFGTLRGFVAKILPSNIGNKAMNSLEIEAELKKNLKEIDNLLAMQNDARFDEAFEQWAKNIEGGQVDETTPTP